MVAFMRFIKSEAGHVEKLYFAVKAASMVSSNDPTTQRQLFIKLWNERHGKESRIESLRSAESHLSFARELGLLTQRHQNRSWQLANGFGRTFLALYENYKVVPKNLLLALLLLNDKDVLKPYIDRLILRRSEPHQNLFQEAWVEFYTKNRTALIKVEPIVKSKLELRTCRHHVEARDKFLFRSSGLGLKVDDLTVISNSLLSPSLDDEIFKVTTETIYHATPQELSQETIINRVMEYHQITSVMSFASAKGAWAMVNELSLPSHYSKWSTTIDTIKGSQQFMTQPAYDQRDQLFAVTGRTGGMQTI